MDLFYNELNEKYHMHSLIKNGKTVKEGQHCVVTGHKQAPPHSSATRVRAGRVRCLSVMWWQE